jgi:hypothetical protein
MLVFAPDARGEARSKKRSCAVSWEMVAVDTYLCPFCRAELHVRPYERQGWLRCPACSRPSLPPERAVFRQSKRPGAPSAPALDGAAGASEVEQTERGLADEPASAASTTFSPARLVFITGLALSLVMALFAFLDDRTANLAIFGALALGFLVLLLRASRRRPESM